MNLIETLSKAGIIPVIVIEKEEQAVPLARALVKGGLPVLEVTFRTKAAPGAIAAIRREVPEAILGAGTLLTPEMVKAAKAAGAVFGVAPGFDPVVLAAAKAAPTRATATIIISFFISDLPFVSRGEAPRGAYIGIDAGGAEIIVGK